MVNYQWNDTMPAAFCEGIIHPYASPYAYEIVSTLTGGFVFGLGIFGLLQPRLDVILKLLYAAIAFSGIGTILLHYRRIYAFNYADVYPMIISITFGLIALNDELVFELRRNRATNGNLLPSSRQLLNESMDVKRTILDCILYLLGMLYLVVGLVLVVFADDLFTFDIVGFYFGVPFAILAAGGLTYLSLARPDQDPKARSQLALLRNRTILSGILAAVFKVVDAFYCTPATYYIFPHALFHIFVGYASHGFCIFIAYYRANNYLIETDDVPEIIWIWRILPRIKIPHRHWDQDSTPADVVPRSPASDITGTRPRLGAPPVQKFSMESDSPSKKSTASTAMTPASPDRLATHKPSAFSESD